MRVNVFTNDDSFFIDAVEMRFTTSSVRIFSTALWQYVADPSENNILLVIETVLSVFIFEFSKKGIDGIIDNLEKGRYEKQNAIPCFYGGTLVCKIKNT